MKNPLTPAGIEPATFRFVAQHLNHCATAVPHWVGEVAYTKSISTGWELRTGTKSQNTGNNLIFLARSRKSVHPVHCGRAQDLARATLCTWPRVILTSTHTHSLIRIQIHALATSEVPSGGGGGWELNPPQIPKALQNCAKLNPIWVNC
jgi:hypothetical protein